MLNYNEPVDFSYLKIEYTKNLNTLLTQQVEKYNKAKKVIDLSSASNTGLEKNKTENLTYVNAKNALNEAKKTRKEISFALLSLYCSEYQKMLELCLDFYKKSPKTSMENFIRYKQQKMELTYENKIIFNNASTKREELENTPLAVFPVLSKNDLRNYQIICANGNAITSKIHKISKSELNKLTKEQRELITYVNAYIKAYENHVVTLMNKKSPSSKKEMEMATNCISHYCCYDLIGTMKDYQQKTAIDMLRTYVLSYEECFTGLITDPRNGSFIKAIAKNHKNDIQNFSQNEEIKKAIQIYELSNIENM